MLGLMLNDWIKVWTYPYNINNKMYNAQIKSLIINDDESVNIECVIPDLNYEKSVRPENDFEGILITEDFLQRNGFERMNEGYYKVRPDEYSNYIIFNISNIYKNCIILSCNLSGKQMEIHYVHELQHILNIFDFEKSLCI